MLLQSDIARLVLGYLAEQNMPHTFNSFLNESSHVAALYNLFSQGLSSPYIPTLTVFGKTLCIILDEYSCMKETESQYLRSQNGQINHARKVAQLWEQFENAAVSLRSYQIASVVDCHSHSFRPCNVSSTENNQIKALTPDHGLHRKKNVVKKVMKLGAPQTVRTTHNINMHAEPRADTPVMQISTETNPAFRPPSTTLPSSVELNRRKKMRGAPKRLSDVERRDVEKNLQEPIAEDSASQLLRNVTNNEPEAIAMVGATILNHMKKCSNASKVQENSVRQGSTSALQQPSIDLNETRCNQESIANMTIDSLLESDFLRPENPEFMKDLETLLSLSSGMEEKSTSNAEQHPNASKPDMPEPSGLQFCSRDEDTDASMDLTIEASPLPRENDSNELNAPTENATQSVEAVTAQTVSPTPEPNAVTEDARTDEATSPSSNTEKPAEEMDKNMSIDAELMDVANGSEVKAFDRTEETLCSEKSPMLCVSSDDETATAVRSIFALSEDESKAYNETANHHNDVVSHIEEVTTSSRDNAEVNVDRISPECQDASKDSAVGGFFHLGQIAVGDHDAANVKGDPEKVALPDCHVTLSKSEIEKSGYVCLGTAQGFTPTKRRPRRPSGTPVKSHVSDLLDSPAKHTRSKKTMTSEADEGTSTSNLKKTDKGSRSGERGGRSECGKHVSVSSLAKSREKHFGAGKMPKIKMKSARRRSRERKAEKLLSEQLKKHSATKSKTKSSKGAETTPKTADNSINEQKTPNSNDHSKSQIEEDLELTPSPVQTVLEAVCLQSKPTPVKNQPAGDEKQTRADYGCEADIPTCVYSSPRKLTLRYGLRAIDCSDDDSRNSFADNVTPAGSDSRTSMAETNDVAATTILPPKTTAAVTAVMGTLKVQNAVKAPAFENVGSTASSYESDDSLPRFDVKKCEVLEKGGNNVEVRARPELKTSVSSTQTAAPTSNQFDCTLIYTSPTTSKEKILKATPKEVLSTKVTQSRALSHGKRAGKSVPAAFASKNSTPNAVPAAKPLSATKRPIAVSKQNVIRLSKEEENLGLQAILDRLVKQVKACDRPVYKTADISSSASNTVPVTALNGTKTENGCSSLKSSNEPTASTACSVQDGAAISNLCRQEVTGESLTLLLNETSLTQVMTAAKELSDDPTTPASAATPEPDVPTTTTTPEKKRTFSTISPTAGIFSVFQDDEAQAEQQVATSAIQNESSLKQWLNTECSRSHHDQPVSLAAQGVYAVPSGSLKKWLSPAVEQCDQERHPTATGARRNLDFVAVQAITSTPVFTPAQQHYDGTKKPRYRKLLPKTTPFPGISGSGIDAFEIRQDISKPKFPQGAVRRSLEVRKTPTKTGNGLETASLSSDRQSAFYPVITSTSATHSTSTTPLKLGPKPVDSSEVSDASSTTSNSVRKSNRIKSQRIKVNYKEPSETSSDLVLDSVSSVKMSVASKTSGKTSGSDSRGAKYVSKPQVSEDESLKKSSKSHAKLQSNREEKISTKNKFTIPQSPKHERSFSKSTKSKSKKKKKDKQKKDHPLTPGKEEDNVVLQYIHKEEEKLSSPEESRLMILESSFSDEEPQKKKEKPKKRKKDRKERTRGVKRRASVNEEDPKERRAAKRQKKLMKSLKHMSIDELAAILNQVHGKKPDSPETVPEEAKTRSSPAPPVSSNETPRNDSGDVNLASNRQTSSVETAVDSPLKSTPKVQYSASTNQNPDKPVANMSRSQEHGTVHIISAPNAVKRVISRSKSHGDKPPVTDNPHRSAINTNPKNAPLTLEPYKNPIQVAHAVASPPFKPNSTTQSSILSPCSAEVSLATEEGTASRPLKARQGFQRKPKRRISLTHVPCSPSKLGASPLHLRTPSPAVTCRDSPNTVSLVAESLLELSKGQGKSREEVTSGEGWNGTAGTQESEEAEKKAATDRLVEMASSEDHAISPNGDVKKHADTNIDGKKKKSKHKKRKNLSLDNLDISKFLSKIKYD